MSGETVLDFPIVNNWAKGVYLARITGESSKYWVERDFVRGTAVKSRRVLEYLPGRDLDEDPTGWYLMRDRFGATSLLLVSAVGYSDFGPELSGAELLEVFSHGLPGVDPDAWDGVRCDCGGLVFPESGCASCAERAINGAGVGADLEVPF